MTPADGDATKTGLDRPSSSDRAPSQSDDADTERGSHARYTILRRKQTLACLSQRATPGRAPYAECQSLLGNRPSGHANSSSAASRVSPTGGSTRPRRRTGCVGISSAPLTNPAILAGTPTEGGFAGNRASARDGADGTLKAVRPTAPASEAIDAASRVRTGGYGREGRRAVPPNPLQPCRTHVIRESLAYFSLGGDDGEQRSQIGRSTHGGPPLTHQLALSPSVSGYLIGADHEQR